jgi:hypothetical protein
VKETIAPKVVLSACCRAPLEVRGWVTRWYVCRACGKPADPA